MENLAHVSEDLRPGQRLRHVQSGAVVTLDRRKQPYESKLPGWWLRDNEGGLADAVIADGVWEPVPDPAVGSVRDA